MDRSETVENGMKARGKKELLNHLDGIRLSARQALAAKCYDCMGYFSDGKSDCQTPDCPLYPYMAYNPARKKKRKQEAPE